MLIGGGIVLLAIVIGGLLYYLHARHFESTDDAFIDAHVVHVAPQIAAKVLNVAVDDNQFVQAGDLLVTLDPRDFEVQVAKAKASLATAEGQFAQAQVQVEVAKAGNGQAEAEVNVAEARASNAEKDYARSQELREKNVVSPQEIDATNEAKVSSEASLKATHRAASAAAAQINLAEAQVETAKA